MGRSAGDPTEGPDKKRPTGKEIMKRRTPDDLSLRPARFEFDPKKAYTTEQLAEIGAITLKEGLNKGLAQGRRGLAVVHRPQYGVIGACWCRFGMSAPL